MARKREAEESLEAMKASDGQDYRLKSGKSCWIIVDGVSVQIRRTVDGRVSVMLYREGVEASTEVIDQATAYLKGE